MKITTTKTTVRDLLALLEGADPNEEVSFSRTTNKPDVPCWCGCGGTTKSRFVPGHDSRFHGAAKRVARDLADYDEEIAKLPHDEAVAEFDRWITNERPLWALKQEQAADAKAAKEATKEAEAATETAVEEIPA